MAKKNVLGKGLDSLIPENIKVEKNESAGKELLIRISDIEPNKEQPRKKFDEDALNELAESIKQYGIIQPIVVTKPKNGFYEIIAGERRWRAAKKAGLDTIPCLIRDEDEQKNKEISLIENIQRENLNPIEKALGYKELIDNYNLKQQELADRLGISRSYVANTLRILNLDKRVIELALEGKLTEGHCKTLMAISDPNKQYAMALKIVENDGTVGDVERMVKNEKKLPKRDKKYIAACRDIEDSFQRFFGTKVKLNAGPRSGKIIIQYSTNDELERILELVRKDI